MDASALRAEFPVLADRAYLNAGTCGPLPHAAVRASLERARPRRVGGAREGLRRHDDRRCATASAPRTRRRSGPTPPTSRSPRARATASSASSPAWSSDQATRSSPAPDEHPGLLGPLTTLRSAPRRGRPRRRRSPTWPTRSGRERSSWPARTSAGSPARVRARGARAARRAASCSTARRASGAIRVRRGCAGLRLLRGLGPEVAVRPDRQRDAVGRAGVARAPGAGGRHLREPRERERRPRRRAAPRRPRATTRPASRAETLAAAVAAHDVLADSGWPDGPRARADARRRAGRAPRRGAAGPSPRAARRRSSPSRTTTPRRRATASPPPASSSATCPARRTCARPWARGTTSATSSACSRPSEVAGR